MELSIFAETVIGENEHGGRVWDTVELLISDFGKDDVYIRLGKTTAKAKRQDLIGLATSILIEAVRGGR